MTQHYKDVKKAIADIDKALDEANRHDKIIFVDKLKAEVLRVYGFGGLWFDRNLETMMQAYSQLVRTKKVEANGKEVIVRKEAVPHGDARNENKMEFESERDSEQESATTTETEPSEILQPEPSSEGCDPEDLAGGLKNE